MSIRRLAFEHLAALVRELHGGPLPQTVLTSLNILWSSILELEEESN